MNKRKKTQLIVTIVAAVLVVGLVIGGFFVFRSLTALKSIQISPDFTEQELDIDTDYTFTVVTDPTNASLKNAEYVADNGYATITVSETEKGKFTLHTMAEGTITVVVRDWDTETESNALTFSVVDQKRVAEEAAAAQAQAEAEAAAAAEAQAQAEAEAAAAAAEKYVITTDQVRVRATPSTDGEIVGLVDVGTMLKKIEDAEDWTKLEFEDGEAYIKTEFLKEVTQEEAEQAKAELEAKAQEEEEVKEAESKKEETKKEDTTATTTDAAAQAAADAAAKKAAEDAAALAAAQQAAAAAAAASPYVWTYQGVGFTQKEVDLFHSLWDYTGNYDEFVTHHTSAELVSLCQAKGLR